MHFDDDFRRRHAAWFAAAQTADGGFPGRQGPADLYYTGFGLRGLALLDALTEPMGRRAAEFLSAQLAKPQAAVSSVGRAAENWTRRRSPRSCTTAARGWQLDLHITSSSSQRS